MKFGTLYSYWGNEWQCDYFQTANKIAQLGFDIMEIGAGHLLTMSDEQLEHFKEFTRDLGLTITCNIGPAKEKDVASIDEDTRNAGVQFLSAIMKAMDKIDSRTLVGVLYTYWPNDFTDLDKPAIWARGVQSVRKLGHVAEHHNIEMCLEVVNRFETHILNTCAEAMQFCDEVDNPNVIILLDTFHMNIEEDHMASAIYRAGKRLGELHVGEGNRKLPGEGSLPWSEIGKALQDINFHKGIVMEPFYLTGGQVGKDIKVWRDLSEGASREEMDARLSRSLKFLKHRFAVKD
ncbi:MAG TPA: sugar phosphate isomerase/epimerase [Clostridiales bacterium]|nr:sugar phosphate isomerase/epimerase [Clostridiales bacterium]